MISLKIFSCISNIYKRNEGRKGEYKEEKGRKESLLIPYSAYISRVFNFANFASLESFAKLIQRIFDTSKLSHIGDVLSSAFAKLFQRNFKKKLFAKI